MSWLLREMSLKEFSEALRQNCLWVTMPKANKVCFEHWTPQKHLLKPTHEEGWAWGAGERGFASFSCVGLGDWAELEIFWVEKGVKIGWGRAVTARPEPAAARSEEWWGSCSKRSWMAPTITIYILIKTHNLNCLGFPRSCWTDTWQPLNWRWGKITCTVNSCLPILK